MTDKLIEDIKAEVKIWTHGNIHKRTARAEDYHSVNSPLLNLLTSCLERIEKNNKALKFVDYMIDEAFEGHDVCGDEIQEYAEGCGLLESVEMQEACNEDYCSCNDNVGVFPISCLRKTYPPYSTPKEQSNAMIAATKEDR